MAGAIRREFKGSEGWKVRLSDDRMIDAMDGEYQCLGEAAAGRSERHAEDANMAVGRLGLPGRASRSPAVTYLPTPSAV
jgi:hypothetical protein